MRVSHWVHVTAGLFLCVLWTENASCLQAGDGGRAGNGGLGPQQQHSSPTPAPTEDAALARYPQDGMTNATEQQSVINITVETATPGLPFPVPPGVVVMFMDSHRVLHPRFTLRCPHEHARYLLSVALQQLSHARVGRLSAPVAVSLSCEDVRWNDSAPDAGRQVLEGSFNVSLESDLLGKAMLIFSFQQLSEPHSPMLDTRSANITQYEFITDSTAASLTAATSPLPPTHTADSALSTSDWRSGGPTVVHSAVLLVLRPYRVIDIIFRVTAYAIGIAATIAMGCKTDLQVVRHTFRKPTEPIIGFCCQYICMPLIAYGVARGLKLDNPLVSFGIFACGVCPGGGASNMYSYLLGGDLSLSVTLTIVSTIASLGMIPLWLFTLGGTLDTGGMSLNIPYLKVLETLAIIILPLFLGMFLQYRFPKVAKLILKIIKPVFVFALIFMLSIGIYANLYIFRLFEPMTILAGCLLPYIGYVVGGLVAGACRRPWPVVKTIALETGIQNVGVAFLILVFSLPPPDGELAAVGPAASAMMTGFPPLLLTIAYLTYKRVRGLPSPAQQDRQLKQAMLHQEMDTQVVVKGDTGDTHTTPSQTNGEAEKRLLTNTQSAEDHV